ncbi:MAG: mechanosensitive ion channel family protein [Terriglobales bacterium]
MFLLRRASWVAFFLLLAACLAGWWLTEGAVSTAGFPATAQAHSTIPAAERPLAIARAMSGLADTPAESQLASQTEAMAIQYVDAAVRQQAADAAGSHAAHSGPLWNRLQLTTAAVARTQAAVQALAALLAHAPSATQAALVAQQKLLQAQLSLDQARLADAQEDFDRSGGAAASAQSVAARQKAAEQAATAAARKWQTQWQQQSAARNPAAARGLVALAGAWQKLRTKEKSLRWAQAASATAAAAAQAAHDQLHAQLQPQEAQNRLRLSGALGRLQAGAVSGADTAEATSAAASAQRLAAGQRRLVGFDQAAQLEDDLAAAYQRWATIGAAQEELALHDAAATLLEILIGIALLLALDWLALRALARAPRERRRLHTLRYLIRFALEVAGAVWVLLALLGSPAQWLTFLGLAGAGLTVALQDTILSFCGWFVLIGKRGLAPGDWVEINHISGEVVEITLLQTALQEDGNWTEPGHPTGRRVLFPNSFVFTGPYLKFSTHGQWLWDEIRLPLERGAPLPDLAALSALVEQETGADATAAASEWEPQGRLHSTSAPDHIFTPTVQLKPGQGEMMDLSLRYITTASNRAARRERLYRRLYDAQAAAAR